jgi:hypothetical protein
MMRAFNRHCQPLICFDLLGDVFFLNIRSERSINDPSSATRRPRGAPIATATARRRLLQRNSSSYSLV